MILMWCLLNLSSGKFKNTSPNLIFEKVVMQENIFNYSQINLNQGIIM